MATYTAPTTRASGYLVTAANWNTDIVENIKYFKDAPTFDGAVTASSTLTAANNVGLAATKKLYLDGVAMSGDTYISESSANVLSLFSGGVEAKLTSGLLTVSGAGFNYFSAGTNAQQAVVVTNTTNGTAATALLRVQTTAGTANYGTLQAYSSGYTTGTVDIASSVLLQSEGSGGLSLAATNGSGVIRFYSGGSTERMTIQTNGYVGIGVTSSMGGKLSVTADPAVDVGFNFNATGTGAGTVGRFQSNGTSVGSITVTGSATSYNTSSDERLKRDLGVAVQTDVLRQTIVRDFEWLVDGVKARGIFAQEAYAVAPFAVTIGSDEMTDGHLAKPWSVDYSKFVPDLIIGWQQHDATINQLAARIAALEAAQESK